MNFLFCFVFHRWKSGAGRANGSANFTRSTRRRSIGFVCRGQFVRRPCGSTIDDVGVYQQLVVTIASYHPHHFVRFDVWWQDGGIDVRTQISVQDVPTGRRQFSDLLSLTHAGLFFVQFILFFIFFLLIASSFRIHLLFSFLFFFLTFSRFLDIWFF